MTWKEFKEEVDRQLESDGIRKDLEISYINTTVCDGEFSAYIDHRLGGEQEFLAIS